MLHLDQKRMRRYVFLQFSPRKCHFTGEGKAPRDAAEKEDSKDRSAFAVALTTAELSPPTRPGRPAAPKRRGSGSGGRTGFSKPEVSYIIYAWVN